jgi:hypothetical protein
MEEIKVPGAPEFPERRRYEPPVWQVLMVQLGFFLVMGMVGVMLYTLLANLAGWGTGMLSGHFSADATASERWQMRLLLSINQFTSFLVAGLATVWVFYREDTPFRPGWRTYLQVNRLPGWSNTGLAVLMMLVSIPVTLYLYNINKALPMPEVFHLMEGETAEALKGLLRMDNWTELFANLVLIALLPAIGEELVFRGVVQQQLMRRFQNPWTALLLSAAIFSFAHFQFEGFLPRMLLGLVLGWLYWRTRSFWVSATAHFFNNGLQVVGQYLYGKQLTTVDLEQDVDVPWYLAFLSLLLMAAIWRRIDQQNRQI